VTRSFFVRIVLAAVGLIVLAGPAPAIGQSAPTLRILVTNNYEGLSQRALNDAKDVAVMLFKVGGIRIEWIDYLDNDLPLVIAFPPPGGGERMDLQSHVLAQTIRQMGDGPGGRALVFVDRVEKRAKSARIDMSRLLAAVMAHEIGHMLLNDAHSATGLMRPHWGDRDLQLIDMAALRFSANEPDRIRRELAPQVLPTTTRFNGLRPMEMCPCSFSKISTMSPW
jgi:hypothetical protein